MDDVLSDIVIALESWTDRIVVAESRIKKTRYTKKCESTESTSSGRIDIRTRLN